MSRALAVKSKSLRLDPSSGEVLGFWLLEMLSGPKCGRNQWELWGFGLSATLALHVLLI